MLRIDGQRSRFAKAAVLSVGLGLAAGEAIVRVSLGSPLPERLPLSVVRANPHRGWEMVPGLDHYTYEHPVRINSLGLRGPEVSPRKAAGEVRVLALGDSMVYGQGAAEDETLPAHLETLLDERSRDGRDWTVVNGGLRGYTTSQEVGLLQELGPKLQLDAVVLFWYWNDLKPCDIPKAFERMRRSGPITFDVRAAMSPSVEREWRIRQVLRHSALAMFLRDELRASRKPWMEPARVEEAFRLQGELLQRAADLAERHGWRLFFAVVPEAASLEGEPPSVRYGERATELAKRSGFEIIDLFPSLAKLRARSTSSIKIPYDGHYAGAGNRALAEPVARALLASALD